MSLNKKFTIFVVLSSFFVLSLTTIYEVYIGYRSGKAKITQNADFIRDRYVDPIALSLYNFDQAQLGLLLQGIETISGVRSCRVVEKKPSGLQLAEAGSEHAFVLSHMVPGLNKVIKMGYLVIELDYDIVTKELWHRLSLRVMSIVISLLLLTVMIMFFFRRIIAIPLSTITTFAEDINFENIQYRLDHISKNRDDELGKVVAAINGILNRLEKGILEKNQATEALQKSEEAYKSLVENAKDAIFILQGGRIQFCNTSMQILTGLTFPILASKEFIELIHDDDKINIEQRLLSESNEDDIQFRSLLRIINDEGQIRLSELNAATVEWEGETALLCFMKDVTEQKKVEEQLTQSLKMDSIGRLAGGVAHDLNNLLTPILGYGEILQYAKIPPDSQKKAVEQILRAGEKARDLIKQLLAFSRKQTLDYKPVNLNEIVQDLKSLLVRTVRENIEIKFSQCSCNNTITADKGQLEQVLMNLVVNASDAMPSGGKILIETSFVDFTLELVSNSQLIPAGKYVSLSVEDSGIGMTKEIMGQIYEPFFSTKGNEGTGLGLSTVYGIIKQHHGFITLYSEVGLGTKFTIYFPKCRTVSEDVLEQPVTAPSSGTESILVVEDNIHVLDISNEILTSCGYNVTTASSPREAIEMFQEESPQIDILLTDVIMPEMNGKELFGHLRQFVPDLKVLYMSGYSQDIISHHGTLAEGVQLVQKPFTGQDLTKKMREVLDK